ncbi:MAG TPA: VTT domain-containing protein [Casimicrobiaceae bacterium]|nr:VTT domain-containing protein [Casimicrobiaceae bacterium]
MTVATAIVAPTRIGASPSQSILAPGRNCWRIEHAKRFALLVDGENYFRAVREAIREAQHSVFVLGWDVDSRMRLVPEGANDGWPEQFADFLDALVRERKDLRVYVLSWDFAMLYMLEREWLPIYKMDWRTHRRLSFQLDAKHPLGGSHHQKVVVVDDSVAFVSGFDITRSRWDSSEHKCEEPRRRNPFGLTYGPFHDLGAVVEGDCARALGELARERWRRATGTPARAKLAAYVPNRWPVSTPSDIDDIPIAIARTEPRFDEFEGSGEVRALHLDAIASAKRDIFGENQYFTSKTIADAFEARLVEPEGPDIAIISPAMQSGWLEVSTMGVLRARLHAKLKAADAHDRYRLYCPKLSWLGEDKGCLNVHSKVLVVDDEFVTVGSANLSDRSMGLDTECNLAIEANGDPRIQQAIRRIRYRLLGEHLDCDPRIVEEAHEDKRLIAAIASLHRDGERTLATNDPPLDPTLDAVVPDHTVLDPEKPIDADQLVADLVSEPETRRGTRQRVFMLVGALLLIGVLAMVWRSAAVREWIDVGQIVAESKGFSRSPLSVVAALGAFIVGGLVLFPVTILIAATVLVFGPIEGALYALVGALLSAASTYALGRWLGRDRVRSLAGPRLNKLSRRLAKRGLLAMTLVRLLPVAPFSIVNGVAGASHISWRDFLLGTVLGMAPGIALTAAFIDRAVAVVREPGADTVAVLIAIAVLAFALYWPLQKRLGRLPDAIPPSAEHVG